jgi:uncharacterized protein YfaS (alpha-2-macroglobulin family)
MATTYNDVPAGAQVILPCIAGVGGVVRNTLVSMAENVATTATSGHAFICLTTADEGQPTDVLVSGVGLLLVNGNSTAITAMLKIKPATAGYGVAAGTNKDAYSCLALGASTTAADVIRVAMAHGVANI